MGRSRVQIRASKPPASGHGAPSPHASIEADILYLPGMERREDDPPQHQSQLAPAANKFHVGNGEDGKHYWLTPWNDPVFVSLTARYGPFDHDPCPCPKPADFDGLTQPWGQSNYVNPPFGSIIHQ